MGKDILDCKFDRISNLPLEITDTILTFLPLRETVRASILSTKWRYRWMKLTKLVFDDTICQVSKDDDDRLIRYKLISVVNQILMLHDGPIREFSLSHSILQNCPEIDNLMMFLSKNIVREISFKILKGEKYKLPSSFFSCQELTHMDLSNCVFTPPPAFKGFCSLVNLKFVNVVFSTDKFDTFISGCPQLESLTLIEPPKFQRLAISAPKLKCLHFEGNSTFLCFGSVPLLQSVSLLVHELSRTLFDEETCRLVNVFSSLPALKKLVTNYGLLWHLAVGGGVPKKLPTSICLETLILFKISFDQRIEVSSIFCLISSCPSIQKIEIKMYHGLTGDENQVIDFLKAQDCIADVTLDELRDVHLTGVSGIDPELAFIKLLLAKSPALQTMLIKPKKKDASSRLELLKKVTRFKRASSMAEIIFE